MSYYLYESALGYSLFKLNSVDQISLKDDKIISQIGKFQSFKKMVSLEANHFFHGHGVAWQTIQELKDGKLPESLKEFLSDNLPQEKKKIQLAVQDKGLAKLINKDLNVKCITGELQREIFRGIREHFSQFISKINEEDIDQEKITKANLGLGHALARQNVQFDKRKNDKNIVQAFSLLDQMEKNLNTFCMRIKDSYGWHFPELVKLVKNSQKYVQLVKLIGSRDNLSEISLEQLVEITEDEDLANLIILKSKSSLGNELHQVDEKQIVEFAEFILDHFEYKHELQNYLKEQMEKVAPNLTSLLGESIGAKLLTHAGGLNSLSKLPSSTIQILGAEKALFRAIKKKTDTPKYGLLFNSTYISKANANQKGKISRMLANKCALASRFDNFLNKPTNKFGLFFKNQLDKRIDSPNDTKLGRKNIEQMEKLVDQLIESGEYQQKQINY